MALLFPGGNMLKGFFRNIKEIYHGAKYCKYGKQFCRLAYPGAWCLDCKHFQREVLNETRTTPS